MLRPFLLATLSLALPVLATSDTLADEPASGLADRLAECRAITKNKARLACYDGLAPMTLNAAASSAPQAAPAAAMAATASAAAGESDTPPPLTDDVAKATIDHDAVDREEYAARVTRCTETRTPRRTYFYMENDQVWRQSNSGRLSLPNKSCEFSVILRKDGFGWVMQIPSADKKVRVRRVR